MEVEIPVIGVIFLYLIAVIAGCIDPLLGVGVAACVTTLLITLIWGATSGAKAECELKLLKKSVEDILDDFDVVDFLKRKRVNYDEWLKSQIFELLREIKSKVKKL